MTFKPPGGDLTFWSGLWIIAGIVFLYLGITQDRTIYIIAATLIGLPAIGLWFEQRWCGYLLIVVLAMGILIGLGFLFSVDDTTSKRLHRLIRIGMSCYFLMITYRWARDA